MIDAHVHFWQLAQDTDIRACAIVPALRRDFGVPEFRQTARSAGVTAAIAVQAEPSLRHSQSLLALAEAETENPDLGIAGVVGWVDVTADHAVGDLRALARSPLFKGIRLMIARSRDPAEFLGNAADKALGWMADAGFVVEVQAGIPHLELVVELHRRHPSLTLVLTGAALPWLSAFDPEVWSRKLEDFATRTSAGVLCKLNGFSEASERPQSDGAVSGPLRKAISTFGPSRVMAAGNWPICTLYDSYSNYWHGQRNAAAALGLSNDDADAILGNTARRAYRL